MKKLKLAIIGASGHAKSYRSDESIKNIEIVD